MTSVVIFRIKPTSVGVSDANIEHWLYTIRSVDLLSCQHFC